MNDLQLRYFTAIVELGSFSEAALELDISQSAVSKQIMALEDELGVKLFDRSTRRVHLSKGGERLYQDALSVLAQVDHLKESAKIIAQSGKRQLTILALPVIGHYNFYIPLEMFENEHPSISIQLEELEEPDMYRRINLGEYDAAITYLNPTQAVKNARFIPLVEDEMILVCHNSHPLSQKPYISPEMLDDVPVQAMQKYTCTNQLYEMYFRKHRTYPHVVFRGRPGTILAGAEAGRGPALLTRIHTETLRIRNVSLIPFQPSLKGILGIIINEQSQNEGVVKELASLLSQSK